MTWKWIERLFPEEREPLLTDADMPGSLDQRLLWLLGGVVSGRWGSRGAMRLRVEMAELAAMEWARLDETLRRQMSACSPTFPLWLHGPGDVHRLSLPRPAQGAVLGLIAMHPNGFIRDAAVQRLASLDTGDELEPLLVRANDWVPPVREHAVAALHARVTPVYAEPWMRALPLVLRLRTTGRADGRPLVDAVLTLLGSDECRDQVWKGLRSSDFAVRRASFSLLRARGRIGLTGLVFTAMRSQDAMLRLMAARSAAELDTACLGDLLEMMLRDGFAPVRTIGIRLAPERVGTAALHLLRKALLDSSAAVRGEARAALERLDPTDFAAFYRERVAAGDGPRLAQAVAGLAETGDADDADLIAPLADHPRPRVRAAALRALDRLAGSAAIPALTRAVGDPSPSVSRVATAALRPHAQYADASALGAWMRAGNPVHVRRNVLSLLARRTKWDALPRILRALADGEPAIRQTAHGYLERWIIRFNRSFSQPTPAQRDQVLAALEPVAGQLEPRRVDWLRFVLRGEEPFRR